VVPHIVGGEFSPIFFHTEYLGDVDTTSITVVEVQIKKGDIDFLRVGGIIFFPESVLKGVNPSFGRE